MYWNKSAIPAGLSLVSLLILFGCDKIEGNDNLKSAALVNGQIIAASQVDAELGKIGQIPPEQSQDIANRILKNFVDQELLAQQAAQTKLEAQAEVRMKLAAARRQILAEAQIAAMTKEMAAPSETEIKGYFEAHPELFGKRRVYKLQELIASTSPENIDEVRELANKAKDPRELAATLQARNIQVGGREVVKAAEDLPAELLVKLSAMKPGQTMTQVQGGKLNLVIMIGAEERPVDYEQAAPMIARYLANTKKREQVEAELAKLAAKAKIEYQPPYAAFSDIQRNLAKP